MSWPKIKKYSRKAGGRWAVGRIPGQLFLPITVKLTVDGKQRTGKLILLFDDSGRRSDTARVEYGDCFSNFLTRPVPKRRR